MQLVDRQSPTTGSVVRTLGLVGQGEPAGLGEQEDVAAQEPHGEQPAQDLPQEPGAMKSRTMAAMTGTRCFIERPT